MTETPVNQHLTPPAYRRILPWVGAGLAAVYLVIWLWNTPPGLMGKAVAIAYAVCDRLDSHSLHLDGEALPLCARCTGTYLGAVLGLVIMAAMKRGRAGRLSPKRVLALLVVFIGIMGIDGINSMASTFPGLPHLYQPQNRLRTTTGMFEGLALVALVYPIFNQTLWKDWEDRPALASLREVGLLAILAVGLIGLVLSDQAWVVYPLALLSAAGVVMMLTLLDTVILLIVTRHENRAESWTQAVLPLLIGVTLAMMQIGAIDAVRYAIFQTWGGFVLPS